MVVVVPVEVEVPVLVVVVVPVEVEVPVLVVVVVPVEVEVPVLVVIDFRLGAAELKEPATVPVCSPTFCVPEKVPLKGPSKNRVISSKSPAKSPV